MRDRRKSGESAMKGWDTRRKSDLSHDDWCRLSRAFNQAADLRWEQDVRINDWLKRHIAKAAID